MCFNPSPVRRVPSPNRYIAVAKFCFCKNNKRLIDCARPLSILLRGLEALWSPWIGISAPYPCATALTLPLVLALALALALAPARLAPALDTRSLHRLTTLRTSTTWKKQKIRDRDAEKKVSSLPGWRRTNTGRTQAKTGGESNISLARTSICIK
jgi:hypothetical protein